MLTTIKGIYEEGLIKPLEKVDIKDRTEIIIVFLNTTKEKKSTFFSAAGSWKDIDTENLKNKIYQNRGISTRGEVKL